MNTSSQSKDSNKPKCKPSVLYQFKEEGTLRKKELKLITFEIESETESGWWMHRDDRVKPTWISKKADKRIAWPTIEEALKDYRNRKHTAITYHNKMAELQTKLETQALEIYEQQKEAAEV